jgi:type VI protein secretion system component Hcp
MSLFSLNKLLSWLREPTHRRPVVAARRPRLALERLEDRTTPSALSSVSPLAVAPPPVNGLTLAGLATSMPVKSFEWSVIGRTSSSAAVPRDFHFAISAPKVEPLLWVAVATGEHLQQAVFTLHEAGNLVQWTMTNVSISVFTTQNSLDTFDLHFATLEEVVSRGSTSPGSAQYNFTTNTGTVTPPPASTSTVVNGLKLEGLATTLVVKSYDWSVSTPVVKAVPQDFQFVISPSAASPILWYDAVTGEHLRHAVFTLHQGTNLVQWTLGDVAISSFQTQNGSDTITLNFSTIKEKVTPLHGSPVTAGFDFHSQRRL